MELTNKQYEGLKTAVARYRDHDKYTCIAGYAGTGKSTLVKFIIDALGIDEKDVGYMAYTGKAAQVLAQKGCPNACTAHRLLYDSYRKNDGTYYHRPKSHLDYKVVVVDEMSMLPADMWELLMRHNVYVIACGDPMQLPAISKDQQNHILDTPHVFLDEIMRQEAESEIVQLSMKIRNGEPIKAGKGKTVNIIKPYDFFNEMYEWPDQVICATNKTRQQINNIMRQLKWGEVPKDPIVGDKIICLKNDWDIGAGDENNPVFLVNGLDGQITHINKRRLKTYTETYNAYNIDFAIDNGVKFKNLTVDYNMFQTGESTINKLNFKYFKYVPLQQFDYGYAISCWKAQGLEFGKVLIREESWPYDKEEHTKFLYTAVTRAKDKLTLVLKS